VYHEAHFSNGLEEAIRRRCRFCSPYATIVYVSANRVVEALGTLMDANVRFHLKRPMSWIILKDIWIGHPQHRGDEHLNMWFSCGIITEGEGQEVEVFDKE